MKLEGTSNRIAFVNGGLYAGGASEFVSNIVEGLPSAGGWHCKGVAVSDLAEVGESMVSRGFEVLGPFAGTLVDDRIGKARDELARFKPQAVVASLGLEAFELLRAVPVNALRIAMVQSDDPGVYHGVSAYMPWIDVIGCVSLRACERMIELDARSRDKVEYLPYGVRMNAANGRIEGSAQECRVVYVGRLIEEQKRMSLQLEVMEKTLEANPHLSWTLAGDGPDRPAMEQRLAKWGDRVKFLGHIPNDAIPALLQKQDLFFLCSDYEGLPLSLLEAMGAGVVPVVSDLPSGISQVVDESTGVRIDPADRAGYVDAVLALAADPARRRRLAEACRSRVENDYSITAMARRWNDMLVRRLEPRHISCDWPASARIPSLLRFTGQWRFHPRMRIFRRLGKAWKKRNMANS